MSGTAETLRAFVAIDVNEALRNQIKNVQAALSPGLPDVKWVEAELCHLTLKFLGNVSLASAGEAEAACSAAARAARPFELAFTGVGGFPGLRNTRVLWMGISAGQVELVRLQRSVEETLAEAGFPADERPFSPHLTLGRFRRPFRGEIEVERYHGREFGRVKVDSFRLVQSVLSRAGPAYSTLASFSLGSA